MMKASELVHRHLEVAQKYNTVYMWGCFGAPITEAIIREKAAQYPDWYTAARLKHLRSLIGKNVYGFDCVNLTKGILWGWCGDKSAYYGGAKYASNGVPDVSADGMIVNCRDVSATGWDKLLPGEGLWMPGHWGLYIGDGLAVECTSAWSNGVQITAVSNIASKSGCNARKWTKHGKLPWVEYDTKRTDAAAEAAKATIRAKAGLTDSTISYLAAYKYGDDLLKKLAAAMK